MEIQLDGSFGMGPEAELVIVTKTENGRNKETRYAVPYWALDTKRIQNFSDANLILGFSIVKSAETTPGLKELGL